MPKRYNIRDIEKFIFNTFFCKLKKECKTELEFLHHKNMLRIYNKLKADGNKSHILQMKSVIKLSVFYTKKQILLSLWTESVLDAKSRIINPTSNGEICTICMDKEINIYIAHGNKMHACICSECAFDMLIMNPHAKCPLCREEIDDIVSFFDFKVNKCGDKCTCKKLMHIHKHKKHILIDKECNSSSKKYECGYDKYTII